MFRSAGTRSGNASLASTVAAVSSIIGLALEMDGRFQSALGYYQQELATYKRSVERDPQDMMARSDLSGAYYDVGDTLVKMGRFKDGLATIRRAIALDKELVSVDPKRGALRSLLAQHRVAEAEALNKVGDAAGALQSYKEARSFYQSLAELDNLNLDARLNVSATDAKIAATICGLDELMKRGKHTGVRCQFRSHPRAAPHPIYKRSTRWRILIPVWATWPLIWQAEPLIRLSNSLIGGEANSWYEKSLNVWHSVPNRSVISPSAFDVGDPVQVANHLAVCKAALDKLKSSPAATTSEMLSPKAVQ
jgi:tetratricopeptide (TPR) repeat protein